MVQHLATQGPTEPFNVTTPNLGLNMPTVGADDDTWGTFLNANAQILDNAIVFASGTPGAVAMNMAQSPMPAFPTTAAQYSFGTKYLTVGNGTYPEALFFNAYMVGSTGYYLGAGISASMWIDAAVGGWGFDLFDVGAANAPQPAVASASLRLIGTGARADSEFWVIGGSAPASSMKLIVDSGGMLCGMYGVSYLPTPTLSFTAYDINGVPTGSGPVMDFAANLMYFAYPLASFSSYANSPTDIGFIFNNPCRLGWNGASLIYFNPSGAQVFYVNNDGSVWGTSFNQTGRALDVFGSLDVLSEAIDAWADEVETLQRRVETMERNMRELT